MQPRSKSKNTNYGLFGRGKFHVDSNCEKLNWGASSCGLPNCETPNCETLSQTSNCDSSNYEI